MTVLRAAEIEVGVKGQRLLVRGSAPPSGDSRYWSEQEIELDLQLARELLRLLGEMIPLAEKSKPPSPVTPIEEHVA
jgi:hypothetical protein